MTWLTELRSLGHIAEAVTHFNHALDVKESGKSHVDVSRALFDGLNKIQTEWLLHRPQQSEQQIGEVKAFKLLVQALLPDAKSRLLQSPELRSLVMFEPLVMDHDTLRRGGYRPDVQIDPRLARSASSDHRRLVTSYADAECGGTAETEDRILMRAAELLYVVRSNIAHGEKTPFGPDLAKKERDENVCSVVWPLQSILFDLLLERPSTKLITYGTLAPGEPNHHIIQDIPGAWERCRVQGFLNFLEGLTTFSWDRSGPSIGAQIFLSDHLPGQWRQIDDFEGIVYKRRLITASMASGVAIANIYVGAR